MSKLPKNPVAKFAHKFNKSYAHADKTKYDRVKEKCTHWDLDYMSYDELKMTMKDSDE